MTVQLNKTNLIVNYLPQQLSDKEFHDLFSKAGNLIASKIVRDKATGYSYGFGFVDYETEQDAGHAIDLLNGYQLQHKHIKVSYSRVGDNVKGANLYLRNLPKDINEADIERVFGPYGTIIQIRVLTNPQGIPKGIGFVLFSSREQAEAAMKDLDGTQPPGFSQPLNIKFAEDNKFKMRATTEAVGLLSGNNAFGNLQLASGTIPQAFNQTNYVDAFNNVGPLRNQGRLGRFNPINNNNPSGLAYNPNMLSGIGQSLINHQGFVLFVYNIGTETDEFALWQLFSPYGAVKKVSVIKDTQKNQSKGYGFVTMVNYEEALFAIQQLNGFTYGGKTLQVSFKQ